MNADKKNESIIVYGKNQQNKGFTQSSSVRNCFEWVDSIIAALVIVVVIFTFFFRIITVSGDSMLPNLEDKYRLILSSFMYHPKQGDIVVITHTAGLSKPIIKRVIALPGQKVDINYDKGIVSVDGKALNESAYIKNGITHRPDTFYPLLKFPQKVPAGHIFVLGDNRPKSEDSRFVAVGMVDEKYVLGKAEFILFPFSHIGKVKV